jgi:hypothetical protein
MMLVIGILALMLLAIVLHRRFPNSLAGTAAHKFVQMAVLAFCYLAVIVPLVLLGWYLLSQVR